MTEPREIIADDPGTSEARAFLAGGTALPAEHGQVFALVGVANQIAKLVAAAEQLLDHLPDSDGLAEAIRLGIDGSDLPAALDLISEAVDISHQTAPPRWRLLLDRLRYLPERTPVP